MVPRTGGGEADLPRVLVVDHVAAKSGGQLAMARLADELRHRFRFDFAFAEEGPVCDRLRLSGHNVHILPLGEVRNLSIAQIDVKRDPLRFGPTLLRASARVARLARRVDADLVYTNSQKAHIYGGIAARMSRRPWVMHQRDILCPPYVPQSLAGAMRAFSRSVPPTMVIANSMATAAVSPARVPTAVIPSGATRAPSIAVPPSLAGWPRLGLLGRIVPWKGQHIAIEALPRLREAFPDCRLVIGGDTGHGDPDYLRRLIETADRLGVGDAVTFAGFVEDPYAFFSSVHIALLTSTSPEPFGQVVVEALSVGRPVIATTGGGPDEILGGSGGGVLVAPGRVEALATAIEDVVRDPARLELLGRDAAVRAGEYGINRSAERTEFILHAAMRSHRRV